MGMISAPLTFPSFNEMPMELRLHVLRQRLIFDRPQIHYNGPELTRVEGPLPFCGFNSQNMALLHAGLCHDDYYRLMKEPSVVEHILHVSKDNVNHLGSWSFKPKMFRNLTFLVQINEGGKSLANFFRLIRDFLLRITWSWDVEVLFELTSAKHHDIRLHCRKSVEQALHYDFKDTLKTFHSYRALEPLMDTLLS